jgi:hypothetical protein
MNYAEFRLKTGRSKDFQLMPLQEIAEQTSVIMRRNSA